MFKFVNSDTAGLTLKRHQSRRACEPCRKRKKRCHHDTDGRPPPSKPFTDDAPTTREYSIIQTSPISTHPIDGTAENLDPQIRKDTASHSSDAHSSSAALPVEEATGTWGIRSSTDKGELSQPIHEDSSQSPPKNLGSRFIGDLSPESILLAATSPDTTRGASMNDSVGVWLTSTLSRRGSQAVPLTLSEPSPSSLFYSSTPLVQKVLIPMLEQECLATMPPLASLDALSKIYFDRMHPIFPVVNESLYHSLQNTDPGRILLQQAICLAASKNFVARPHLFLGDSELPLNSKEFGDRVSGAMRLSIEIGLVSNKIILIQALTLMSQFIDAPDGGDLSSQLCAKAVHHVQSIGLHVKVHHDADRNQYGTTLLCCIWAIDRMNAAFNGRPVLIHERDLRSSLQLYFDQQEPCFRLFIQVILLLDKVIGLYRPSSSSNELEMNTFYPTFEDLVVQSEASHIGTIFLATIEILYHAVMILSCRSKSWTDPPRSSNSYIRQGLSALTLSSTIGHELQDQIVLFPFVPYAVSLALSVFYRELRYGKIPSHRPRCRVQFQTICDALAELKIVFRSAATTADMGKKLLKEMDRVVSTMVASGAKTPIEHLHPGSREVDHDQVFAPAITNQALASAQVITNNGPQVQMHQVPDTDPFTFDSIADIDLFSIFDPTFNLDSFDSYLGSSLNPPFLADFE
ncbi:hypothetical protein BGZ60DRAFT_570332 [Tricladium varicosporioides]|nr:hypothetical protein BGZ60DRAFT_570332 [Hymenoscyphus varicosporioides]